MLQKHYTICILLKTMDLASNDWSSLLCQQYKCDSIGARYTKCALTVANMFSDRKLPCRIKSTIKQVIAGMPELSCCSDCMLHFRADHVHKKRVQLHFVEGSGPVSPVGPYQVAV